MDQPSTILVVDDDRLTRQILSRLLEPEGHRIVTVGDGQEAFERAGQILPDVILLDVLMPGMDGYELCRRLREDPILGEVPIIMLTALDDRRSRLDGMEAGADDFLSKPFDRVELLTRVRSITRLNRFRRLLQERSQLERAEREVLRRVRELELLNELITSTAASLDAREVLELGCASLARAFAPASACALRPEAHGPKARCLARVRTVGDGSDGELASDPRSRFEDSDLDPLPEAPDYSDRMAAARSPFALDAGSLALGATERRNGHGPTDELPSVGLVVPIISRGKPDGWIELLAAGREDFDELELGLAESIATAVAQALEKAELYGRLQRHAEDLEVTVQRRTRELAAERDRIRAILEALGEAAFVIDVEGRLEYINPAGLAMSGYERQEVIGQELSRWHPDRRIERFLESYREGAEPERGWTGELTARRKDGTYYDAMLTLAPLLAPEDPRRAIGFVGVQRDVTPLKEAERLKERFVSNVSHELRTPLSVITLLSGNLDGLADRISPERRQQMIRDIRRQAQVLDELIRDVLEISSIDSGRIRPKLERIDLAPLLRDEIQRLMPLAERGEQQLLASGPDSLVVEGDPQQLRRVLRNLVNNALKYSDEGSPVRCEWRAVESGRLEEPADWPGSDQLEAGDWAAVRVVDQGIGIDDEDQDRVFERFYRVNNQGNVPGTGLGLSITRELIGLHAGIISLRSAPGSGSIFAFYLPRPRENSPS